MEPNGPPPSEQPTDSQAQAPAHNRHLFRRSVFAATTILGVGGHAHGVDAAPPEAPPAVVAEPVVEDVQTEPTPTTEPVVEVGTPPVPSSVPGGVSGDIPGEDGSNHAVTPDTTEPIVAVDTPPVPSSVPGGVSGDIPGEDGSNHAVTPDTSGSGETSPPTTVAGSPEDALPATGSEGTRNLALGASASVIAGAAMLGGSKLRSDPRKP